MVCKIGAEDFAGVKGRERCIIRTGSVRVGLILDL